MCVGYEEDVWGKEGVAMLYFTDYIWGKTVDKAVDRIEAKFKAFGAGNVCAVRDVDGVVCIVLMDHLPEAIRVEDNQIVGFVEGGYCYKGSQIGEYMERLVEEQRKKEEEKEKNADDF